ncbi:MAG: dihydropteroate synthase [Gemmataceae bacterium]
MYWQLAERRLELPRRPRIMGILNVTPDSFSDGGRHAGVEGAVARALTMIEEGADLIDVGGESTRPGANPVDEAEELERVLPVVTELARHTQVPLSIDTSKAAVARACLEAGAHIINDVTALRGDPRMLELAATTQAGLILMHMQGTPQTMQLNPNYTDVMTEIHAFFTERLQTCQSAGIDAARIVLDPGIGFGKTGDHNLEILARLGMLGPLGRPVCLGVSRKHFLGKIAGSRPVHERLPGSLAAVCDAAVRGTAHIVRVHDVKETHDAFLVLDAIARHG